MTVSNECYKSQSIDMVDGIPVFSVRDDYIENYERISNDHLSHLLKTGHNPFMSEEYWRIIEASTEKLLKKYTSNESVSILDVGVGMGRLLERFPTMNRFGMDISLEYLKHAKVKSIQVCMSRIEDMPYKENYFDVIVSTDVLEHVVDLNLAVNKILAVLKQEGILIVRVPYKEDLAPYLSDGFPYDMVHLRSFDENILRILFEKIFGYQFLEYTLAGHENGRLRIAPHIRYVSGIMRRVLRPLSYVHSKTYSFLCETLFQATEINFVVRKTIKNAKKNYL